MTTTPFQALTDPQLQALRRLLTVGLASITDPDRDTLRIVALAEDEVARRADRMPLIPTSGSPSVAPGQLVARLSAAVAAVDAGRTSTTKWRAVESILASALALSADAVYVVSVGGLSRNVLVRLTQSRRARQATVAAVVWTAGGESTDLAITAASRACLEIPRLTLVFALDPRGVELATILTPSLPAPALLTLAYPSAAVITPAEPTTLIAS